MIGTRSKPSPAGIPPVSDTKRTFEDVPRGARPYGECLLQGFRAFLHLNRLFTRLQRNDAAGPKLSLYAVA